MRWENYSGYKSDWLGISRFPISVRVRHGHAITCLAAFILPHSPQMTRRFWFNPAQHISASLLSKAIDINIVLYSPLKISSSSLRSPYSPFFILSSYLIFFISDV
jgi:hypothetical protein